MGGCSTPISALAEIKDGSLLFKGNITRPDGREQLEIEKTTLLNNADNLGEMAARELLARGGDDIIAGIRKKGVV